MSHNGNGGNGSRDESRADAYAMWMDAVGDVEMRMGGCEENDGDDMEGEWTKEDKDEETYDDGDESDAEVEVATPMIPMDDALVIPPADIPVPDADAYTPEPDPASTPAVRARARKVRKPKSTSKAKSNRARKVSKPKRKTVKTQAKKSAKKH
jgi:hypothetical protein